MAKKTAFQKQDVNLFNFKPDGNQYEKSDLVIFHFNEEEHNGFIYRSVDDPKVLIYSTVRGQSIAERIIDDITFVSIPGEDQVTE